MNKVKNHLYSIYQTHGALTFMLALYPILPKVVEIHTKAYLKMTKAMTGSVEDIDEAIRIVFGRRGLKEYEEFKKNNPKNILPSDIFTALYKDNDPDKAMALIKSMFFDPSQRSFKHSDKFRASIILAIPEILAWNSQKNEAQFGVKLISMRTKQAIIDQALASQMAFIDTALHLLAQQQTKKDMKRQKQLKVIYKSIEAKIKAELAGKASAFTAPPNQYMASDEIELTLSPENEHNLKEVLLLLSLSPAPDVQERAIEAIKAIEIHLRAR